MLFDDNLFKCQREKKKKKEKKAAGLQISHFYWSFSSDIMAVEGLIKLHNYLFISSFESSSSGLDAEGMSDCATQGS